MYSKILVALDGSKYSLAGGEIAISLAQKLGSEIIASHIYDAKIHSQRFRDMEPILPEKYQEESSITHLRESHKGLIFEGFEALSKGYMDEYLENAKHKGVHVTQLNREGRNYIELLNIARERSVNLVILGAHGLGEGVEGLLGSTALRVLRLAACDVLIARKRPDNRGMFVGIDGSEEAFIAMRKGVNWARTIQKSLTLVSVYDPAFHSHVFETMAHSLSPERQEEVGLSKQETLHESFIDDGLGKLYQGFLDDGCDRCSNMGFQAKTRLLQGKAYSVLVQQAENSNQDFIVVGRYGHHRENLSHIGSHSEAVARLASTNVLVAETLESSNGPAERKATHSNMESIEWDEEALARLQRIPSFARPMAKTGIESHARSMGAKRVTLQHFMDLARNMGMLPKEGLRDEGDGNNT
jgi:nucleotide-binding universal stress UspA family protein